MPKRFSSRNVERKWPRSKRKQRFIYIKNQVRANNGYYYTHHVEDGKATWLDFWFMSKRHHGRYFSVAAITLEHHEYDNDENAAFAYVDKIEPLSPEDTFPGIHFIKIPKKKPGDMVMYQMAPTPPAQRRYYDRIQEVTAAKNKEPRMSAPYIDVHRDYGPVAFGLHVALNTPYLDEATVINFIKMYRKLGEPITRGIVWTGEEVEVVPAQITNRLRISEPINLA